MLTLFRIKKVAWQCLKSCTLILWTSILELIVVISFDISDYIGLTETHTVRRVSTIIICFKYSYLRL